MCGCVESVSERRKAQELPQEVRDRNKPTAPLTGTYLVPKTKRSVLVGLDVEFGTILKPFVRIELVTGSVIWMLVP